MSKRRTSPKPEPLADLIFRSGPGPGLGLCQGIACTTLKRSEMLSRVNRHYPSGTKAGWQVSTKRVEGKRSPLPCLEAPGRKHYLLEC